MSFYINNPNQYDFLSHIDLDYQRLQVPKIPQVVSEDMGVPNILEKRGHILEKKEIGLSDAICVLKMLDIKDLNAVRRVDKACYETSNKKYLTKLIIFRQFSHSLLCWNQIFGKGTAKKSEIEKSYHALPNNIFETVSSQIKKLQKIFSRTSFDDLLTLFYVPERINREIPNLEAVETCLMKLYPTDPNGYEKIDPEVLYSHLRDLKIESGWYLATQSTLPDSECVEDFDIQECLIGSLNENNEKYRSFKLWEAVIDSVFSKKTNVFNKCENRIENRHIIVGNFPSGISVLRAPQTKEKIGFKAIWKL